MLIAAVGYRCCREGTAVSVRSFVNPGPMTCGLAAIQTNKQTNILKNLFYRYPFYLKQAIFLKIGHFLIKTGHLYSEVRIYPFSQNRWCMTVHFYSNMALLAFKAELCIY
jgi:hypothetical protein